MTVRSVATLTIWCLSTANSDNRPGNNQTWLYVGDRTNAVASRPDAGNECVKLTRLARMLI